MSHFSSNFPSLLFYPLFTLLLLSSVPYFPYHSSSSSTFFPSYNSLLFLYSSSSFPTQFSISTLLPSPSLPPLSSVPRPFNPSQFSLTFFPFYCSPPLLYSSLFPSVSSSPPTSSSFPLPLLRPSPLKPLLLLPLDLLFILLQYFFFFIHGPFSLIVSPPLIYFPFPSLRFISCLPYLSLSRPRILIFSFPHFPFSFFYVII